MEEIEKELLGRLGKEGLEGRIASKLAEYHSLIPRESAAYLVSLEEFGPKVRVASLSQAKQTPQPSKLLVRIERVFQQRKFERGGKDARVQRAAVSDQSGSGTLVCYDDACAPLEEEAASGDLIDIQPVRFRNDEFHLSHGGKITVVQKGARAKLSGSEGIGTFEGTVSEVFGDFPLKKNGADALATSFSITDGKDNARVVCWEGGGIASRLHEGMRVIIENGVRRGGEIHVGAGGRLLFGGVENRKGEKIVAVEISGDDVIIATEGGRKITIAAAVACELFGLGAVPDGIKPITAVALKKSDWVGRELPHDWKKRING